MCKTLGLNLTLFVIVFSIFLNPRESVQDLEQNTLVESIDDLHPAVIGINNYMVLIIGCLYILPLSAYIILYS